MLRFIRQMYFSQAPLRRSQAPSNGFKHIFRNVLVSLIDFHSVNLFFQGSILHSNDHRGEIIFYYSFPLTHSQYQQTSTCNWTVCLYPTPELYQLRIVNQTICLQAYIRILFYFFSPPYSPFLGVFLGENWWSMICWRVRWMVQEMDHLLWLKHPAWLALHIII